MTTDLVLVDTSAWIFALKKRPNPAIKGRIEELLREDLIITIPMITLELLGGVKTERDYERLHQRLTSLRQIEMAQSLWDRAFRIAFELRRKGLTVPYADIVIAASAIQSEATLMHADRHFEEMKKHISLVTESFV